MNAHRWKIACLILAGVALGALLSDRVRLQDARAQGDGRAGNVIVLVGMEFDSALPIILVDTQEQTLLVYEYQSEDLELMCARSYNWDRLLTEFNIDGVSVDDVRREVQR